MMNLAEFMKLSDEEAENYVARTLYGDSDIQGQRACLEMLRGIRDAMRRYSDNSPSERLH